MGRMSTEQLILKLNSMGLPYDPTMSYAEMSKLIKEHDEKNAPTEETDHVITQADLDANPELIVEGVKVGDVIQLPSEKAVQEAQNAPESDESTLVGEVVPPTAVKAPKGKKTMGEVKYNLFHNDRHYKMGELVTQEDPYFEEILALGHLK